MYSAAFLVDWRSRNVQWDVIAYLSRYRQLEESDLYSPRAPLTFQTTKVYEIPQKLGLYDVDVGVTVRRELFELSANVREPLGEAIPRPPLSSWRLLWMCARPIVFIHSKRVHSNSRLLDFSESIFPQQRFIATNKFKCYIHLNYNSNLLILFN